MKNGHQAGSGIPSTPEQPREEGGSREARQGALQECGRGFVGFGTAPWD